MKIKVESCCMLYKSKHHVYLGYSISPSKLSTVCFYVIVTSKLLLCFQILEHHRT